MKPTIKIFHLTMLLACLSFVGVPVSVKADTYGGIYRNEETVPMDLNPPVYNQSYGFPVEGQNETDG